MKPERQALLDSLERFGRENDAATTDRTSKMLNLEPDTAALVHILARAARRESILEIGTSNGYSTIWLADATAGRVTTIERNPAKIRMARENFVKAGVEVTILEGDAVEVIRNLPGPFDCVFFDADRASAPACLESLLPKLTPDALLLCDNVLSHPDEVAGFLEAVAKLPEFSTVTVPTGKGLQIAHRSPRQVTA